VKSENWENFVLFCWKIEDCDILNIRLKLQVIEENGKEQNEEFREG